MHNVESVARNKGLSFKIRLGHVTLADFLRLMTFNADGSASLLAVVEAWQDCAQKNEEADGRIEGDGAWDALLPEQT